MPLHTVIWQVACTWKEFMLFGFGKTWGWSAWSQTLPPPPQKKDALQLAEHINVVTFNTLSDALTVCCRQLGMKINSNRSCTIVFIKSFWTSFSHKRYLKNLEMKPTAVCTWLSHKKGRATNRSISRRTLSHEIQLQTLATLTDVLRAFISFPQSKSSHQCSIFIHWTITDGTES